MIHLDSIKGISKDAEGIAYLKRIGADAIITMISNIKVGKPDAVLIMPMTVPQEVYEQIFQKHDCILAGGLGSTHEIIQNTLDSGICACIVSDRKRITEIYE